MGRPPGPIEAQSWPEVLVGHTVTAGARPRLHGYDVEGDLARHYRFSEVMLLALVGELPSEEQAGAFDVAMAFLAPLSVAEGPTHAAVLAQISGARSSGVLAVAAVTLAERARAVLASSAGLLEWLASPGSALDPALTASSDEDREAVERLREALAARGIRVDALDRPLGRLPAILATLWAAGLTRPEQLEGALVIGALPSVLAETRSHDVASFREYPMQVPPFEYEDP